LRITGTRPVTILKNCWKNQGKEDAEKTRIILSYVDVRSC